MIIEKGREAAAILTNMVIQQFHEISLSLNSNKSLSICTEHDHFDERPHSINSYHNIFSLYKGAEISYLGIDFSDKILLHTGKIARIWTQSRSAYW